MADAAPIEDLLTIRDWLRFATSRFREAGLTFGHGTSTALDEGAFLILKTLNLPIDTIDPWLDCRLTHEERRAISGIVAKRIETRKPASYLVNEAYIRGHSFYVDERVIVPRSYIGELLHDGLASAVPDPDNVESILDLCTGSGCLAILAALEFPIADVEAADISPDALDVARRNVTDYGLGDRITITQSDLFAGLGSRQYDLIISNPPYVAAGAIAEFPPEYRAEPVLAHAGGSDGLEFVRKILKEAGRHLTPEGVLVVEIGTGLDILENEFPDLPFLWLDTQGSSGEVFALSAAELNVGAAAARGGKGARR